MHNLELDRRLVEFELESLLCANRPEGGPTLRAMQYAVLGQGKRVRPLLALRLCHMMAGDRSLTVRAGAAVELIHCAALVIDDLPCMDNELQRRGRPCTHIEFGESTAVLAAFGMVALAARSLLEMETSAANQCKLLAFQSKLLATLDAGSLLAGQALDLALSGPTDPGRTRANELKTVPLFELAAQAGALFTDFSEGVRADIQRFGYEFGMAFQLADDFVDGDLRDPGIVLQHVSDARRCLSPFGANRREVEPLLEMLEAHINVEETSSRRR